MCAIKPTLDDAVKGAPVERGTSKIDVRELKLAKIAGM